MAQTERQETIMRVQFNFDTAGIVALDETKMQTVPIKKDPVVIWIDRPELIQPPQRLFFCGCYWIVGKSHWELLPTYTLYKVGFDGEEKVHDFTMIVELKPENSDEVVKHGIGGKHEPA